MNHALVIDMIKAGQRLALFVDDQIADCNRCGGTGTVDWTDGDYCGPCPDCEEARAAYAAWQKAISAPEVTP